MSRVGLKLLNCIVSYNRYFYLKNTVSSLLEYFPLGDLLVIDNGSDDPELLAYLATLARERVAHVVFNQGPQERHKVGGLYAAMNSALDYARDHGYDYVYFIQDDMQFMWYDRDFLPTIGKIFEKQTDALQVVTTFSKRVTAFSYRDNKRYEPIPDLSCYRSKDYGVCDIGVVSMSRVAAMGFRFGFSEGETARRVFDKGYRLYMIHPPHLAWIPWPGTRRFVHTSARPCNTMRAPAEKYYYKPLNAEQIASLKLLPLTNVAFHEDYCMPWGWKCLSPYWYSDDLPTYFWAYRQALLSGDLILPRGGFAAIAQLMEQGYCFVQALPFRIWRKFCRLVAQARQT